MSNPTRDRTIRFEIFNGELTSRSNFPAMHDGWWKTISAHISNVFYNWLEM